MDRLKEASRKKQNLSLHKPYNPDLPETEKEFDPPPPPPKKPPTDNTLGRRVKRCSECVRGHRACDGARPCGRCIHVGRPENCVEQGVPLPSARNNNAGSSTALTGNAFGAGDSLVWPNDDADNPGNGTDTDDAKREDDVPEEEGSHKVDVK
ncbi:unnamed protein product [Zymoseptoria tritici ST99CH_3D1]|nr:unnamed protein product [Zymoseptoria tritici ST99CH_3D1]